MTERQHIRIKELQDAKKRILKMKSPSGGFQSEEFEEGLYEGWFDAKTEIVTELSKIIDEIKSE